MSLLPTGDPLAPHRAAAEAGGTGPNVRLCFAAAHVVLQPGYAALGHSLAAPGDPRQIADHVDWPATMALRRFFDDQGLGVAEAMDTAQRFAIGWPTAELLIRGCGALGLEHGFVAGASTDHLPAIRRASDLVDGVVHQARVIQAAGGWPMLLPMPWLCQQGCGERDYVEVYGAILRQLDGPLFVHWLGEMFLPELAGYFPGDSFLRVMALDPDKVRGCKLSLLDDRLEVRVRRQLLPRDQLVLTGDDLHFGRLLLGGEPGGERVPPRIERWLDVGGRQVAAGDFSHALLGVLDAIAVPAGLALRRLAQGDAMAFLQLLEPCEVLGRHLFQAPTRHYKAGLAFLSWLDGRQDNFMLVNREDLARSTAHFQRAAELAAACGALRDPRAAEARLLGFLKAGRP